jgi:hypothetical protein
MAVVHTIHNGKVIKFTNGTDEMVRDAITADPSGEYCGVCGEVNQLADDCGWWTNSKGVIACRECTPFFWGER